MKSKDINVNKNKKSRKIAKALAIAMLVVVAAFGISVGAFFAWAESATIDKSKLPTATAAPVFLDDEGNEIEYSYSSALQPNEIPEHLKNAFVASEDKRFYAHKGYDTRRIIGATLNNVKAGKNVEGASTITQQLVKNTHLTAEKTVSRKLNEIALARKIEREYSKDEILSMYLSVIYFGSGAYGVEKAARLYFDKTPKELTLSEAATLAGIVKNPTKYSPKNNPEEAKVRRDLILSLMREQNYISTDEMQRAVLENVETVNEHKTAYFADDFVRRSIDEILTTANMTEYELFNAGLRVQTTMNTAAQKLLYEQIKDKSNYQNENVEGTAVLVDNKSGAVIAFASTLPQESKRQAGSALKPIGVYAPALDMRLIAPSTPVVDEKTNFGGYAPSNFNDVYYGNTTFRSAMSKSMNTVAVKTLTYVGIENAQKYLNNFGIELSPNDNSLALALGATENGVRPTNLASAYAALGANGNYTSPHFTAYLYGKDGVKQASNRIKSHRAVKEDTAYVACDMLKSCVKDGTAKSLSPLPFEIGAKTGTVENPNKANCNTDAWCISLTSKHTLAIWHGVENSGVEMSELGGGRPAKHAYNVWKQLYKSHSYPQPFVANENVQQLQIDTYSTNKNKKLTLASEYTPAKYVANDLFFADALPDTYGSKFEYVVTPDFAISNNNGIVKITFDAEIVYDYTLTCSDAVGTHVCAVAKDADGQTEIVDKPLSTGGSVTYSLVARLKNLDSADDDENAHTIGTGEIVKKTIYVDNSFYFELNT